MSPKAFITLLAVLGMSACAGIPKRTTDQEDLERYLQYAGEPVDSVSFLGGYDSWRSLGRDRLVIWTGVNEAYLLSVAGSCFDLPFANRIGIKTRGSTLGRGDSVILGRGQRCLITEVRPIDYRRMKQDRSSNQAR